MLWAIGALVFGLHHPPLAFVPIAAGWILTATVAASIVRALRREGE